MHCSSYCPAITWLNCVPLKSKLGAHVWSISPICIADLKHVLFGLLQACKERLQWHVFCGCKHACTVVHYTLPQVLSERFNILIASFTLFPHYGHIRKYKILKVLLVFMNIVGIISKLIYKKALEKAFDYLCYCHWGANFAQSKLVSNFFDRLGHLHKSCVLYFPHVA